MIVAEGIAFPDEVPISPDRQTQERIADDLVFVPAPFLLGGTGIMNVTEDDDSQKWYPTETLTALLKNL